MTNEATSRDDEAVERLAIRIDSAKLTDIGQESCSGCRELTDRVARLEQKLERLVRHETPPRLGTTSCYWIVIGIHSALFALSAGNEALTLVMYVLLVGAIGSLATCHVFPVRSVLRKIARTTLSATTVLLATLAPLVLQWDAGAGEVMTIVLIYIAPCFFFAWFVAKMFAWTRNWRILPPGHDGEVIPTKISDILVVTLVVAIYFAACRTFLQISEFDIDDDGLIPLIAMLVPASLVGGLAASLVARGILVQPEIRIRWIAAAVVLVLSAVICYSGYFMLENGDVGDWSEMPLYVMYTVLSALCFMISPTVTFLLMRSAGYRMVFPGAFADMSNPD